MAGFNKVKTIPTTESFEGGTVYSKTPLNDWMNILFSSYMEDKYYESADDERERFTQLTEQIADIYGYEFVAKAAIFARETLGMRSVSQWIAAWLNTKSFENKRAFYRAFMTRPDDVAEIFAAIKQMGYKRSHALVKGSADYLSNLSEYTLGKYKLNSREFNMFDLINITHSWSHAIQRYKMNKLRVPETWETQISAITDPKERGRRWMELVEDNKLGYMALIRNLNNILTAPDITTDWIQRELVPRIEDEIALEYSHMFPYRLFTAYKNLNVKNNYVVAALETAFRGAVKNNIEGVFDAEDEMAVILDVSGSMDDRISSRSNVTIKEVGACFAASLLIAYPGSTTFVKFGNKAKESKYNPNVDNPFEIIKYMCENEGLGYGTVIGPAFEELSSRAFDRVFVISDMQVMDGTNAWNWWDTSYQDANKIYSKNFGNTPLYSFDLRNYSTQIVKPTKPNYHYITSLNDSIFSFIPLLEAGEDAIEEVIQRVSFQT